MQKHNPLPVLVLTAIANTAVPGNCPRQGPIPTLRQINSWMEIVVEAALSLFWANGQRVRETAVGAVAYKH
jgi:hypothetical protein